MNITHRRKIVICDDENNKERDWKTNLEALPEVAAMFEVEVLPPERLLEASKDLESRRRKRATE